MRPRAPEHVVFVALSASVEPGKETQEVLRRIGFRHGAYHFDKRDCERHNVDYIFRNIQYAYTGHIFRDLDWLIPADMQKASDESWIWCELARMPVAVIQEYDRTVLGNPHCLNIPRSQAVSFISLGFCEMPFVQ
jgi:hypothetical protein